MYGSIFNIWALSTQGALCLPCSAAYWGDYPQKKGLLLTPTLSAPTIL